MPTQLTSAEKDALVRRLNSSNDAKRQQAQAELQALIADDVRRIRQCRALHVYSNTAAILLLLTLFIYDQILGHHAVGNFVTLTGIAAILLGYASQAQAREAIHNIATLDVPQAVGALLDVYGRDGRYVLGDSRPALTRLLPRLQATDANLLTPGQRKLLYRILSRNERNPWGINYWNAELKIAILRALEQIGDEKAVLVVEKVARTARSQEVRTAAQECLPFLQQRTEQTRIEQTLLRASTSSTSPDTLLRPTTYTTPTEPQQLLRASIVEDNSSTL